MIKELGVDLGTSYIRICQKGRGIISRTPTVVAVDTKSRGIVAIGAEAKRMIGKTPSQITAYKPIRHGAIADCDVLPDILVALFESLNQGINYARPSMIVGVLNGATEVERRAVENVMFDAGVRSVALVEAPVAAAIGSGLMISGRRGCMIVDCGGGTTEIATLSMGGIVSARSVRIGGDDMDAAIIKYLKDTKEVLIGPQTAETLKNKIGAAHQSVDKGTMTVYGRNIRTGLAATEEVSTAQVREAIKESVTKIVGSITVTLEESTPELAADIYDYGIMLTGGISLLPGLAEEITRTTRIRVTQAKNPLDSTCRGIGRILGGSAGYMPRYKTR